MPDIKILIIEDDRFLSSILKGRLEKEGFQVEQAFDGEEGLSALRAARPNLVLLDLIMPKKSGFEVLEAMSTDPELSSIPVIIASNLGQDSDIQKAKSLGAIDYFVKVRTSIDQLAAMIRNMITQVSAGAGAESQTPQ
jgi:DNA-binding response OmpR family regulator